MDREVVISAFNISFGYEKGQDLFQDIDLAVKRREVHCIFGPNGCGKTTLVDCVMGINKTLQGVIKVLDKDINKYKREDFAREVAYVPQIHSRAFPYTVKQIVMMGRSAYTGTLLQLGPSVPKLTFLPDPV
jgi:iron complex transport system ATP-binding protein